MLGSYEITSMTDVDQPESATSLKVWPDRSSSALH